VIKDASGEMCCLACTSGFPNITFGKELGWMGLATGRAGADSSFDTDAQPDRISIDTLGAITLYRKLII
jgi:hypothetical protein